MADSVSPADCMELVRTMAGLQRGVGQRLSPILQEQYGLDLRLFLVIKHIEMGAAHPGKLARGSLETPSQITRQLDKLEALGFIARRLDPDDSRRIRIDLTDKARATVEGVDASVASLVGAAFATMGANDRRTLIAGLKQIAERLAAIP